jgi:hypothetical protein
MPRSSSTDIDPQLLRRRRTLYASFGQVSIPELAGHGIGVELPHLLAGHDVVGADVSGAIDERFAGRRSQDQDVLPDLSGAARLDGGPA